MSDRFGKLILRVPALRDRPEDIPILVRHFLRQATAADEHYFADDALDAAMLYDWPGNVRELKAVVETVVALAVRERIDAVDVAHVLANGSPRRATPLLDAELRRTLDALRALSGNAELVAAELGVHRSTVYRRLQRAQAEGLYP